MNLEKWETKNKKLVKKMEDFCRQYQEENNQKFDENWAKANQEMCKKASKKYEKEIKKRIEEISLIP